MRNIAAVGVLIAGLAGCAPVQQSSALSTPTNQRLTAGVGDVIFRAEGRESMPNAFGRADLFGRTRPTGLVVVQYGGVRSGKALLIRNSVATQSDATTMSSTPLVLPTGESTSISGTVDGRSFSGTATTTSGIYIPPRPANVTSMQQPTVPIEIDWRRNPRIPIAGQTLVIEAADERSIVYRIE